MSAQIAASPAHCHVAAGHNLSREQEGAVQALGIAASELEPGALADWILEQTAKG